MGQPLLQASPRNRRVQRQIGGPGALAQLAYFMADVLIHSIMGYLDKTESPLNKRQN
jgi:hypothetical protein